MIVPGRTRRDDWLHITVVLTAILMCLIPLSGASAQQVPTSDTRAGGASATTVRIANSSIGYVNVRQEPDLNSRVIGKVRPGEVYAYSAVRKGWYRLDAKQGWIAGRYVVVQGLASAPPTRRGSESSDRRNTRNDRSPTRNQTARSQPQTRVPSLDEA